MSGTEFKKAMGFIGKWEGGYANDPSDPGGETYKGISRKHHPNWPGWKILDTVDLANGEKLSTAKQKKVDALVDKFYYNRYWLNAECDRMPFPLSMVLFDTAVNCGIKQSLKWLQRAFNIAIAADNQTGAIKVDGIYGPITHNAIRQVDQTELTAHVLLLRCGHYTCLADQDWGEKFLHGWMKRVINLQITAVKELKKLNKD